MIPTPAWLLVLLAVLAGPTAAVLVLALFGKVEIKKRSDDRQDDGA